MALKSMARKIMPKATMAGEKMAGKKMARNIMVRNKMAKETIPKNDNLPSVSLMLPSPEPTTMLRLRTGPATTTRTIKPMARKIMSKNEHLPNTN